MIALTLQTIAEVIGAQVIGDLPTEPVTSVETDSRQAAPGKLFWGIKGERFDGSDFASRALEAGASGVVVSADKVAGAGTGALLIVPDTLRALQDLAAWYRRELACPVAAITGSVGKTTITALAFAALQGCREHVAKTYKNYNGQLGLPLSILRIDERAEVAALECGISRPGEMAILTGIAQPTVACVANVGEAHLEHMGALEVTAREKLTLLDGLAADGVAVLNHDDPRVLAGREQFDGQIITYGLTEKADIHPVTNISHEHDGVRFRCNLAPKQTIWLPVNGTFHASNGLAAVAIVHALGMEVSAAIESMQHTQFESMRMEQHRFSSGITALMDAYNASPVSMRRAVEALVEIGGGRRTVAILGDMFELGPEAERLHEETGAAIAGTGVNAVFYAGEHGEAFRRGLSGFGGEDASFPTTEALATALPHLLEEGDMLLLKASRGMRFEAVLDALRYHYD